MFQQNFPSILTKKLQTFKLKALLIKDKIYQQNKK